MEDAIRVELCQFGNHRRIRQDENPSNIGNGKNGKEDPHAKKTSLRIYCLLRLNPFEGPAPK